MDQLARMVELPENLAIAVFGAALVLLLIAMFGHREISVKEIKVGQVGAPGRLLAGSLGLGFLALSLVSFVEVADAPGEDATIADSVAVSESAGEAAASALPAPVTTRPGCGTTIPWPEHGLGFAWQRVEGASTYTVEVDCFGCRAQDAWFSASGDPWHIRENLGFRSPIYTSRIDEAVSTEGGRAIRWRVWAVGHDGVEGHKSEWCQLAFSGSRGG